ncbi:MAG TPA: hypothetical protein VGD23_10530 [Sphingomicrobium sp.]
MKTKKRLKQLAWREYLPLAATATMWVVIIAAIGHAHTARLLAAVVLVRAVQMLTKVATATSLRLRLRASKPVRRQAKRFAFNLQAAALAIALTIIAALAEGLKAIDQHQIAAFLPFVALGAPARYWRLADVRTASPYFRLALGVSGLATAGLAWSLGWSATLFALAFGLREWIAYAALRWWPREPRVPKAMIDEPLRFAEVARYSVILGRRLLTYRLTKSLLAVLGPVGNAAARTGRGLNWHSRIEPYVPHHLGGFIGLSVLTLGGATFVAARSGEPAAMIIAAGLLQVCGVASNVLLLWHWLPDRDVDVPLLYDDEEE